MGDAQSRPAYVAALRGYLLTHGADFGDDFRARVEQNPLRVLDAKNEEWQDVIERAPQLTEYLSDDAVAHFEAVQQGLTSLGITYELAPRLVRGFDYYTATTFEFVSDALDAAQNAVGGGGRYDQLAEDMGGPPTPSIGFGIGIERVLIACDAELGEGAAAPRVDVFVVDALGGGAATVLVAELREAVVSADRAYGGRSMKAQSKLADRSGARYAVILGAREAEHDAVAVKDLRASEATQGEVPRREVVGYLRQALERDRRPKSYEI
jgi:histidyl-tRNA synthetase